MKTSRKILLIVSIVMYAIYTAFLIYLFVDTALQPSVPDDQIDLTGLGNALLFIIFIIIIGSIVYTANTITSISGWIISSKINKQNDKVSTLPFVIFTFLPYITEAVFIVFYLIVFANN